MRVLIVGAGLSGLVAARELLRRGHTVEVVDKGRSVGGRLATRRIGPGLADTGAQFFTVRSSAMQAMLHEWQNAGLVYQWSDGWANAAGDVRRRGHPRYAVRGGMTALAKHLAQGVTVYLNIHLHSLQVNGDEWVATSATGQRFDAEAVILTPPAPQSLALLAAGNVPLAPEDRHALGRIVYEPCLTGLLRLEGESHLPEPGAVLDPSPNIHWLADNRQKGISPEAAILTVQATPEFSRAHYEAPEAEVLAVLLRDLRPWLNGTHVVEHQLKRWRYAQPMLVHPQRCHTAQRVPPLVFAGDAFGEGRFEAAVLSGLAAAETLS
jgi:predicted NAD/FAD-dependent oxidoreductase